MCYKSRFLPVVWNKSELRIIHVTKSFPQGRKGNVVVYVGGFTSAITAKYNEPTINDTMACVWLASSFGFQIKCVGKHGGFFHSAGEQIALVISLQIQDIQYLMMLEFGSHNWPNSSQREVASESITRYLSQLGRWLCLMAFAEARIEESHCSTYVFFWGSYLLNIKLQNYRVGSYGLIWLYMLPVQILFNTTIHPQSTSCAQQKCICIWLLFNTYNSLITILWKEVNSSKIKALKAICGIAYF